MSSPVRFDLVVVGAGAAGLAAASFAARLGVKVAVVEADRVGGDCTWSGCIPSKTLIELAHRRHSARTMAPSVDEPGAEICDLRPIREHIRETIQRVYQLESPGVLASRGIQVITGRAEFSSPRTLIVGDRVIKARRFILATGAEPLEPPIEGLAQTPHWTYRNIFDLEWLPSRLLVFGGGPIGLELGQAFARLGARVTIVEQQDRLLELADPEASAVVERALIDEGVRVLRGSAVERVCSGPNGVCASAGGQTLIADEMLAAFGRRPALMHLGLERAGVAVQDGRLVLSPQLQTSQRHIYAAGDVTGSYQFTHVAGWQGFVAARNALLPGRMPGLGPAVPWVVFTDPEVAQVGLAEAEARRRFSDAVVHRWPMERVDRAQTTGQTRGFLKLVCRSNGRIVGATMVGPHAGEVINELALAIGRKLHLGDIAGTIHAYPTSSFALQQLSAEVTLVEITSGWKGRILRMLARVR